MLQLFATIFKEFLILIRDKSGIAILFIMPVALVAIMALVQDAPFRDYQELKIPALLINNDEGELGKQIETGIINSGVFELSVLNLATEEVKTLVKNGEFEIAIIVPQHASKRLDSKVNYFVEKTLNEMGLSDSIIVDTIASNENSTIGIYFNPRIKKSFKNSVMSEMKQVASNLESESLLKSFKSILNPDSTNAEEETEFGDFISINEMPSGNNELTIRQLNSVQHNVPAWTMFGMFFIVISLAGSIIKEREDGSYLRIRTIPGSYFTVISGKIIAYLAVCMTQCTLMLLVGIWLMPVMGLPSLIIGNEITSLMVVAICSGLAATGYGVLVGTIFNTHQQSSTFGSVSVVIMAALGGIWVPVFVMPESIQYIAEFSPLYWGLNAFQQIFLNGGTIASVSVYVYKLLLFFAFTIITALIINKYKNN